VQALLEELAHAGTGLLALAAFGIAVEGLVVLAVLGGSMPIDLDHPATSVFTGLLTEELGSVAPDQTQWVEQNQRGRSGAS